MPRITAPVVDSQQVALNPLPNARASVRANEGAFGGGVGKALQGAASDEAVLYKKEKEKAETLAIQDAEMRLKSWTNDALYGENGALRLNGKNALNITDEYQAKYTEQVQGIRETLSSDEQKMAFERIAMQYQPSFQSSLLRHSTQEMRAYEAAEFDAYVENSVESAALAYSDPERLSLELARLNNVINARAASHGWSDAQRMETLDNARSSVHLGVVTRAVQEQDWKYAQAYLDKFGVQMEPGDLGKAQTAVRDVAVKGKASELAKEIVANQGAPTQAPTGDDDIRGIVTNAAQRSGVNPTNALVVAQLESGLDPSAKNPGSSAQGLYQHINSTWAELGGGNRKDAGRQAELGMKYMRQISAAVGDDAGPGEFYLTYIFGPGSAEMLQLPRNTPLEAALQEVGYSEKQAAEAAKGNRLEGKTVSEAVNIMAGKWETAAAKVGVSPDVDTTPPSLPTKADYLEQAYAIENPELRAETIKAVEGWWNDVEKPRRDELYKRAADVVEASGDYYSIPIEIRSSMTPPQRNTMRSLAKKVKEEREGDYTTDWERYNDLMQMAGDPKSRAQFMDVDLVQERADGNLGDTEYKELVKMQRDFLEDGEVSSETAAKINEVNITTQTVRNALAAAGFDRGSDDYNAVYDRTYRDMTSQVLEKQRELGRKLTQAEVIEIGDQVTMRKVFVRNPWYMPDSEKLSVQVDYDRRGDVYVQFDEIPSAEVTSIQNLLRSNGKRADRKLVERIYGAFVMNDRERVTQILSED